MTVIRNRPTKCNDCVVAANAWVRLNARALTLLALYALAIAFALYWHAMWRDEMQAWLIVRDSADLPALFHNLRYEGHPALWYPLLTPLTRLSRDPALMQVLHGEAKIMSALTTDHFRLEIGSYIANR